MRAIHQPSASTLGFSVLFLFLAGLLCVPVAFCTAAATGSPRRQQWAVQLHDPTTYEFLTTEEAEVYAKQRGFHSLGQIGQLEGYFLFEAGPCDLDDDPEGCTHEALQRRNQEVHGLLLEAEHVKWFEQQVPKKRFKRDFKMFSDPLFPRQWHLHNDGVNGMYPGHDINVIPVWARGINGSGTTVSVVDDGVLFTHPDLAAAWYEGASYDFNERTTTPLPQNVADDHGTRCAGEIAASPNNNLCGVGVAFGVRLSAQRLIADSATDAMEAQALNYHMQEIDIYSSSWGPEDDGTALDGPGYLATAALDAGTATGRGGLGNIFVFASGNGGQDGDNCNFDSYANSMHTIAIGAMTNAGDMPGYGEYCSAHVAVTYSGGNGLGIATTDIGEGAKCTEAHSGTSAAAPLASGMIALMLSVRPQLGWRDVQHLIIRTAKKTDVTDGDWITNGAGLHVSHKYGFGSMDATLLVEAAEKATLLPYPALRVTKTSNVALKIQSKAQPAEGLQSSLEVTDSEAGGLSSVEHVQVTVRIRHKDRKFIRIKLTSPDRTESILAAPRIKDTSDAGFNPWTFMTVHNWGEKAVGKWTLTIDDVRSGVNDPFTNESFSSGELLSWSLTVHGTCGEEDVVVDPNQKQAGGRTCSHSVAVARQQRRTVIGIVLGGAAVLLLVGGYFFYKRTRGPSGSGIGWTKLSGNMSAGSNVDIESPARRQEPDYDSLRSPIDIESPVPRSEHIPGQIPKHSSSSGFKRSLSIELLAVRSSARLVGGELSPQISIAMPLANDDRSDEDSDSEGLRLGGNDSAKKAAARRVEAVRNEYMSRSKSPSPLTKSSTTGNIAPTLSPAPLASPASIRRNMSKTPPPDFGSSSPKPLSRSSSNASLLKRSASADLLKKFTD
ncbi:Proprotein convertase subtilisin/kexin type 7 [Thoreauomyces humboldtii]|nr:Proprotein convertase subtilisin/kexin type 7 [Thoreauomyces humboldtii]